MSCIVCGGKIVQTCKCLRGDRKCENGHEYHWSPHYQEYHEGKSDHAMPDEMCCLRYKLKLPIHIVYITKVGDDWDSEEYELIRGYEDLEEYKSGEFEKKQLKINGIDWVDISIQENVSDTYLRGLLTVDEYFSFMGVDIITKEME